MAEPTRDEEAGEPPMSTSGILPQERNTVDQTTGSSLSLTECATYLASVLWGLLAVLWGLLVSILALVWGLLAQALTGLWRVLPNTAQYMLNGWATMLLNQFLPNTSVNAQARNMIRAEIIKEKDGVKLINTEYCKSLLEVHVRYFSFSIGMSGVYGPLLILSHLVWPLNCSLIGLCLVGLLGVAMSSFNHICLSQLYCYFTESKPIGKDANSYLIVETKEMLLIFLVLAYIGRITYYFTYFLGFGLVFYMICNLAVHWVMKTVVGIMTGLALVQLFLFMVLVDTSWHESMHKDAKLPVKEE